MFKRPPWTLFKNVCEIVLPNAVKSNNNAKNIARNVIKIVVTNASLNVKMTAQDFINNSLKDAFLNAKMSTGNAPLVNAMRLLHRRSSRRGISPFLSGPQQK